jgi:hypothetical protein
MSQISGPPTFRRRGALADEAVNCFLEIDKRLFHGHVTIGCRVA